MFSEFVEGLVKATGFASGASLMKSGETRTIIRKRRVLSVLYILGIVWALFESFSVHGSSSNKNIFSLFSYLFSKIGVIINPESLIFFLTFSLVVVIVISRYLFAKSKVINNYYDLDKREYFVITLWLALWNYVFVYQFIYILGVYCFLNSDICIDFHKSAVHFANFSTILYLIRSWEVNKHDELSVITFFGNFPKKIVGDYTALLPTAPIPHFFWILCIIMFDKCPILWDMYHMPDGRENVQRFEHIHRRGRDAK